MSYRGVAVSLRGQVVRQGNGVAVSMRGKMDGHGSKRRSSAVEDRVEGKREGGEVVRRWKVETEWRCNGRLPGCCQVTGSQAGCSWCYGFVGSTRMGGDRICRDNSSQHVGEKLRGAVDRGAG